jgi:hypothetical protein
LAAAVTLANCLAISLGTVIYFCCFPKKEKCDMIHGGLQFLFSVIAYLFVFTMPDLGDSTIVVLIFLPSIAYIWGILFGVLLHCKVTRAPVPIIIPAGYHTDLTMTDFTADPMQRPPIQIYAQPGYPVQQQQMPQYQPTIQQQIIQ